MEERYFSDDGVFEDMEIAEEELIDKYVRGELSKSDADRFATTIAGSSRIAERVEFARMWKDKLAAMPSDESAVSPIVKQRESDREQISWWKKLFGPSEAGAPRLAFALSALILVLGGIALLAGWLRIREQSRQLAAQQALLDQRQRELDRQAIDLKTQLEQLASRSPQPTPTEIPKQIETPAPQNERSFVALTLSPGGTRSEGSGNTIRITAGTQQVKITLNVRDTDYASYQAVIRTPERQSVFASAPLHLQRSQSGATVFFSIPANKLPPGDYFVELIGRTGSGTTEAVSDYPFRIIR